MTGIGLSICTSCWCALRRPQLSRTFAILSKPTWSVRSLREPSAETITTTQLHHLLRLAALPLPRDTAEETAMLDTLRAQLQFVRAVQRVDTTGVEPLRAIRDETAEGVRENTITLSDMREVLDKEELVGHYRRPRRVRDTKTDEPAEQWDVLGTASRRAGKYFVVEVSKQPPA